MKNLIKQSIIFLLGVTGAVSLIATIIGLCWFLVYLQDTFKLTRIQIVLGAIVVLVGIPYFIKHQIMPLGKYIYHDLFKLK